MRREDVIERLQAHREDVHSFGVESVRLFGSVARGDEDSDDVDLLVEFEQPPTFDEYMDLKIYLEDLLGVDVDLVTPGALRDRIRPTIEREAVRVA